MKLLKTLVATSFFLAASLSQAAVTPVPFTFDADGDGAATFQVKGAVSKVFSFDLAQSTQLTSWWSVRPTAANSSTISSLSAVLTSISNPAKTFTLGAYTGLLGVKEITAPVKSFVLDAGSYTVSFNGLATSGYKGTGTLTLNAAPVPEPETYALMGLGLVALLARRRKVA
ncbi:FxDxF family PEP-CTERM protein [Iodobacter sp. CM08]|uniref:FxDxF family PEP-CTERM protein n=1 Tax=Iodobacter sp. CM08 TaxID=3085902 RepID=UPI002980D25B|nr:FxDxF family PEP-CTERM protein [Iodobacter sp. CM08]MDW5416693.1 FxDxF family PEP-CTERM protein [Iodobacter sp. CM08]